MRGRPDTRKKRPKADGRRDDTSPEQRIADTVLLLLRTKGPKAVTIEAVANVAGMARTTIYRRYRDRSEMLRR
ncbi:TetR/AcrR family transcriptional regulator [Rhodococcus pyridinivorans]|uniref:TetR/AcrR family transcriptional regulator n=1 Tax=Rhodococcus pyridinivorans TaxID=103816 RepID=UPI0020C82A61|nr:TetR family transcriptional regulator [Rhodococcus pyridinivorans]